jgi:pimeloyl-ACP methyl ester carboxylesterase
MNVEHAVGPDFRVRLWTEGTGQPLLYLHGYDGHPGEAPFLAGLAAKHKVFAPEHPGYGSSTNIELIDDIFDMTLYYREFIESLNVGSVDIVGHSLGAMFAAEIAAVCPQLVRRLVLAAPYGLWLDDAQIPDPFVMTPGTLRRTLWHDAESPLAQQTLYQQNGMSPQVATVTRAMNLSAAGKFLWPIPDRGLAKRLKFVKAPTLVIMGASDGLIPERYGAAFCERIADCKTTTIADAGHYIMIEQADAFTNAVNAFLS